MGVGACPSRSWDARKLQTDALHQFPIHHTKFCCRMDNRQVKYTNLHLRFEGVGGGGYVHRLARPHAKAPTS